METINWVPNGVPVDKCININGILVPIGESSPIDKPVMIDKPDYTKKEK